MKLKKQISRRLKAAVLCLAMIASVLTCTKDVSAATTSLKKANVGDYVKFGTYEQDNDFTNGEEKIEWLVLDKKDDSLFVVSKYALAANNWNGEYDSRWENSSIRSWLNKKFYREAFTKSERKKIKKITVKTPDNPEYGTDGGSNTKDRIFLLSIDEANKYFSSDEKRKCIPTKYAVKCEGCLVNDDYGTCLWWLRSPGYYDDDAARVHGDGSVDDYGNDVYGGNAGVRPALWINL